MKGALITVLSDITRGDLAPVQPRAKGHVHLSTKPGPRGTCLDRLRQSGSLKALFPRTLSPALQSVLVNTAGGVTGGDVLSVTATAQAGTHLTITTQAAERAYLAQAAEVGRITNTLTAEDGARLDWVPQETILFNGCNLRRSLTLDLAETARALVVEPLVFGRTAMGETVTQAQFHDRLLIRRAGRPLYLDAMRFDGDPSARLAGPATANGAAAMCAVIYVAPDAEAQLAPIREMMPATGGVSLIGHDLLVLRLLATDGFALRQSLIPVLNRLTNNTLPRPWMT